MNFTLSLATADFAQVPNFLDATQKQINAAAKRTVRKVGTSVSSQFSRELASAHDVPLKLIRQRRAFKRFGKDSSGAEEARLWIGTRPVKASWLGAMRQTRQGARVRKHVFAEGFIATMKSGHTGIFQRRGRARLPIDEAVVEFPEAAIIAARIKVGIPTRLHTVFQQELNYQLNVRGAR